MVGVALDCSASAKGSFFSRFPPEVCKRTQLLIGNTPCNCWLAFSSGRTNTTVPRLLQLTALLLGCIPARPTVLGAEPRVTIYATSGLMQPLAVHAGDSLSCAELMASRSCHFFEKRVVPPYTTWLLAKRAYQLYNGRWALFLCTGYATHEPSALVD